MTIGYNMVEVTFFQLVHVFKYPFFMRKHKSPNSVPLPLALNDTNNCIICSPASTLWVNIRFPSYVLNPFEAISFVVHFPDASFFQDEFCHQDKKLMLVVSHLLGSPEKRLCRLRFLALWQRGIRLFCNFDKEAFYLNRHFSHYKHFNKIYRPF